jgi:PAS domain S-box-containing protein
MYRRLLALWVFGAAVLCLVTWICFRLSLAGSTVAFIDLIVVVLLSLLDSFVSSALFSVLSVALLDFYFIEPLFSLEIASSRDMATLAAFLATSFAVTALVRRIYRLAEQQRGQARLLDLTHDAVIARDENDIITYWNRAAEEFYGWTRKEALGQVAHTLLRTEFPEPHADVLAILRRTGHWEGELEHAKRDGSVATVLSRWSLQRDASGEPVGTLETNNDITERKQAEEALQRSQTAYLAEAQRLSATGSFGWRPSSGEIFWSAETFRIFGRDPGEVPSLDRMMERVHPEDAGMVRAALDRAAEGVDFDVEHRLLMPDGSVRHLHMVGHALNGAAGALHFVGAVMDVSAAKLAQHRLNAAQAELAHVTRMSMIGQLTASISHEVNQPLAAIVTNGEAAMRWLARDEPQVDEVRDALTSIIQDGKRTSEVVRRIRALVKKSDAKFERLDINQIIDDGVSLVHRAMVDHGVEPQLALTPGLPLVYGDRVQLQQVVINLTVNAIQAMAGIHDRPRRVRIASRRGEAGGIVVSIADSGAGFPPDVAANLFDAFYSTRPDGMGMGLAICRTIIDTHGGRIWAVSGDGTGATFQFSLPADDDTNG